MGMGLQRGRIAGGFRLSYVLYSQLLLFRKGNHADHPNSTSLRVIVWGNKNSSKGVRSPYCTTPHELMVVCQASLNLTYIQSSDIRAVNNTHLTNMILPWSTFESECIHSGDSPVRTNETELEEISSRLNQDKSTWLGEFYLTGRIWKRDGNHGDTYECLSELKSEIRPFLTTRAGFWFSI